MARRHVVPAAIRRQVIDRWGNGCWLGLPGCTGVGEQDDHIVPWSHRGRDSVANIRRACTHCNAARQDRVLSGYGAHLHVLIGPPSADLAGEAEARMGRGDVLVSHEDLLAALCADNARPSPAVRAAAAMAWDAAYRHLARARDPINVYLLRTLPMSRSHPRMLDEWVALDYDITVVDPGAASVFAAVDGDDAAEAIARQWYGLHLTQAGVDARLAARRRRLVELGLRQPSTLQAVGRVEW